MSLNSNSFYLYTRVLHVLERLADAAQRSTSMTRPDPTHPSKILHMPDTQGCYG
ncbi:hypothetical protein HanRHA438_Chr07g0325261 [Helianthus annuus]|nr:hypothetical protein HanRHA438_Chr07g0325261 [Helianthus annuus]